MRFTILGRLRVISDDGAELRIPQPRQRALLTVLLLSPNQEISVSRLTEALWDREGPAASPGALRTQVWALRRALGPAGRLQTGAQHGYRLAVLPGELDTEQFRSLAEQGRRAFTSGDLPDAESYLRQALALWGDPALADIPATLPLAPVTRRLLDERLAATELLNEARLRLGQLDELIPELRQSTAAEPANERHWEQLMLALHGTGRTAEALAAYQQARTSMVAELGLEPGHRLQRLHRRILAGDPELTRGWASPVTVQSPAGVAHAGSPDHVIPRQLPAQVRPFVGRDSELAELTGLLDRSGTQILVIAGTAGVGKTALAVHWAHQVADRFPDGQLYASLRGFDPTGNPAAAAATIPVLLHGLGVPAARIPVSLDAQAGLYRSLLAGRRLLVVLDNARDADQIRPLLPGGPGCVVVITSRSHLTGLAAVEGARLLTLGLLSEAEAAALLAARLGAARVEAEPGAAAEMVRLCARLPLALVIAAARAKARERLRLDAFVGELTGTRGRLETLDAGDPLASLRTAFSWSAGALSSSAAQMFGLLGLHSGPDITVPAAASLAGVPLTQARSALEELTSASLTTEHSPGRFSLHDLLRDYAAEQIGLLGSESSNHEAVGRLLDHYLHTAHAAARLIHPGREVITLPSPRSGVRPEQLAGRQAALSWLEAEREVLISAVFLADKRGFDAHAWQVPWALANFLDWHGHWAEWTATQHTALAAVTRLGDAAAQAVSRRMLGAACARLGDFDQARAHLAESARLHRQLDDKGGEARVHHTLSWLSGLQDDYRDAIGHAERALALHRATRNGAGQASAFNSIGYASIMLGDPQQGRTNCWQALTIHQALGDLDGQASTWHSLGFAGYRLGDFTQAVECYLRALSLYRELGNRYSTAETLMDLGDTREAAHAPQEARAAWTQALDTLEGLHHPLAACIRAKLQQLSPSEGLKAHLKMASHHSDGQAPRQYRPD